MAKAGSGTGDPRAVHKGIAPREQAAAARQPGETDPVARVAVIGATGFTGALAARILWRHPKVALAAVTARADAGRRLDEVHARHRVPLGLQELSVGRLRGLDVALVAVPHGVAAPIVAELRSAGLRVIDLSADFRLSDEDAYRATYGEHGAPELLGEAVYGLPELHRDRLEGAELVAAPGCYPTAALLALAPLVREGLAESVVIDAKSGVSGAGRAPSRVTHFVSVDENVSPYAVVGHRHLPEIVQELATLPTGTRSRNAPPVVFVPHLVSLDQGLLASCYVTPARAIGGDEVRDVFRRAYAGEPFVELAGEPPGVREVRDTNICRLHAAVDPRTGTIMVFSAIDNLWKGAAGQAVQCLNLMLGLDETEGLA